MIKTNGTVTVFVDNKAPIDGQLSFSGEIVQADRHFVQLRPVKVSGRKQRNLIIPWGQILYIEWYDDE